MANGWRITLLALLALLGPGGPLGARADIVLSQGFGPNGDVGFVTSPPGLTINFGPDQQGSIYQMDGFVNAPGKDFGSGAGISADLASGAPAGLSYTFGAYQPTPNQLVVSYSFVNNSGAALPGFQFLYFVDPDIGPNFADESATTASTSKLGFPNATAFQVGDPSTSSIFSNLMTGTLSNGNDYPSGTPGDVSSALAFTVGTLGIGQSTTIDILLSDNGTHFGDFYITQTDPVFTGDTLTVSGAVVPEPRSVISMAIGLVMSIGYWIKRRRLAQA